MGNTASIASNILVFPVPENTKTQRKRSGERGMRCGVLGRVQCSHSPAYQANSSQAEASRTYISLPLFPSTCSPTGPIYLPSPTSPSFPSPSLPYPTLKTYHIPPLGRSPLTPLLHALYTSLRSPADRILRPSVAHMNYYESEWIPTAIFHLTGDFDTSFSSALCSVLLTRTIRTSDSRGQDVLGQHCFVHIFEATHLAQRFGEMFEEWEGKGWVGAMDVRVESGVEEVLEACALGAVRSWVDGNGEDVSEEWVGARMMQRAEVVFWEMWLGVNEGLEREVEGEKWRLVRKFLSRFGIW